MKVLFAALIVLPLTSGMLMAETSDRAVFLPVASDADDARAPVRRATSDAARLGETQLAPAAVRDVDTNRDGKISFDELLRHDLQSDF